MEKEIYDKSSQGGEGINLQRFRLPLDEPILVSLSVMADAFETEVRKVSDRHASAIAKCNTAKAVPLRLVLPVPTLGDDVDGKSFHGRQGEGTSSGILVIRVWGGNGGCLRRPENSLRDCEGSRRRRWQRMVSARAKKGGVCAGRTPDLKVRRWLNP